MGLPHAVVRRRWPLRASGIVTSGGAAGMTIGRLAAPASAALLALAARCAAASLLGAVPAVAQSASSPPPYQIVRHDEDYSSLADPARRTGGVNRIKYLALSSSRPDVYLSLGGELRTRLEVFDNANWLPLPTDAFVLQKYMLSADLHLGSRLRVFANLKS